MNIQRAIDAGRTPGKITCPECKEELFAPMDKISIQLYRKCSQHIEDQMKIDNLFELVEKAL